MSKKRKLSVILMMAMLMCFEVRSISYATVDNLGDGTNDVVSENLASNGDFESGDKSGWFISLASGGTLEITDELSYEGTYCAKVTPGAYNGMLFPSPVYLEADKRYLISFATRLVNPNGTATMKIYTYDPSPITTPYASEISAEVNGQNWTRMIITADTYGNTGRKQVKTSPTTWSATPYYLDSYYIGELIIADLEYTGESTIEIPKYQQEDRSITMDVVAKNQLGTINGLTDETVVLSLVDSDISGVSLEENVLTVTDEAVAQTIIVRAKCFPSYEGAAQTEVYKDISITLTAGEETLLPEARNVVINGVVGYGLPLDVDYKFYSVVGAQKGTPSYQWYASDKEEGPYSPINNQTSSTYVVEEAFENSFIYCEVTPVASDGTPGLPVKSQIVRKPCEPIATDVKITGTMAVDSVLTGEYTYFDANGDEQNLETTTFQWFRKSGNGDFQPISPNGTGKNYTVTEDDIGCYLKFEVYPKATVEPYGIGVFPSDAYLSASKATVKNIAINKQSNTLYTASYTYQHPLDYPEGQTKCRWYLNNSLIAEDMKVIVNESDEGVLKLEIIPVCKEKPYDGVAATKEIYLTRQITSSGSSSGIVVGGGVSFGGGSSSSGSIGGGNSSGGSGSSSTKEESKPTPENPTENPTEIPDTNEKNDTPEENKHWASDAVEFVLKKDIMRMPKKDDFCYDELVTRAEFISYIVKGLKIKTVPYNYEFKDVLATYQYADELQAAVEMGMISRAEKFYPDRPVARDEICKILLYAVGEEKFSSEDENELFENLSDKEQIAEWAVGYVKKAMKEGLMLGMGNNEFSPRGNVTRAQTAVLIKRVAEYIASK